MDGRTDQFIVSLQQSQEPKSFFGIQKGFLGTAVPSFDLIKTFVSLTNFLHSEYIDWEMVGCNRFKLATGSNWVFMPDLVSSTTLSMFYVPEHLILINFNFTWSNRNLK